MNCVVVYNSIEINVLFNNQGENEGQLKERIVEKEKQSIG